VRSRISFRRVDPGADDPTVEKKGLMEKSVHFSMDLFNILGLHGAFVLGVFFCSGLGSLAICCLGISGANPAYLPGYNATCRRYDVIRSSA